MDIFAHYFRHTVYKAFHMSSSTTWLSFFSANFENGNLVAEMHKLEKKPKIFFRLLLIFVLPELTIANLILAS